MLAREHWLSPVRDSNEITGAFAFTLPIEPPVRTAYVANPPALTLTPETTALGLYTIEARSASNVLAQEIDAKAAVPPLTFTLP